MKNITKFQKNNILYPYLELNLDINQFIGLMNKHYQLKNLILFVLVLSFLNTTNAQQDFNTGLLEDDAAFEQNVEMTSEFSNDGRRAADLPRWYSLRPYTPIPQNQGNINSCIGWALGYAALTTQKAYKKGETDRQLITEGAYSALFIYNQIKDGNCLSGAYVHKAAAFLQQNGDCSTKQFDDPPTNCDKVPEATLKSEAQNNALKDFVALFNRKTDAKTTVMRTKRSIAEGKPVVVGMRIKDSLKKLTKTNAIWKPIDNASDNILGGHALCVVGYNDSLGVFEIMNSWGDKWGDNGYFFMNYKEYALYVFQGLQLILAEEKLNEEQIASISEIRAELESNKNAPNRSETPTTIDPATPNKPTLVGPKIKTAPAPGLTKPKIVPTDPAQPTNPSQPSIADKTLKPTIQVPKPTNQEVDLDKVALSGEFVVRMPLTDEFGTPLIKDGEYQFEILKPIWTGTHYELEKKDWQRNDMFQIIAKKIKKDSYIYLFSIDGNDKAEIHWPRNQRFAEHLNGGEQFGKGEGAIVAHKGAEIVIPGNDRVLVRENLKPDHICMIASDKRIDNLKARVVIIRDTKTGTFEERFTKAFGDVMIPFDGFDKWTSEIFCAAKTLERGTAIPIILKVVNE
jgi:C1A family cysteine protease/transposase-like protein